MFKTTLKLLIASSTIVSATVIFNADADAAGKRRGFAASTSSAIVMTGSRRPAARRMMTNSNRLTTRRRPAVQLRARVKSRPGPRYVPFVNMPQFTGKVGVPGQSADKPTRSDLMGGFCNAAGGGASTNPDGTVSCVDSDGNDVLDPTPSPD